MANTIEPNMFAFLGHAVVIFLDGHLRWPSRAWRYTPVGISGEWGSGFCWQNPEGLAGGKHKEPPFTANVSWQNH